MNFRLSGKQKLFLTVISTTLIFLSDSPFLLTLIFLLVFLWLVISIPHSPALKSRFLSLIIIGSFIILFNLIFNSRLYIPQRLVVGTINAQKIITISLLVFIFTQTTSFSQIASIFSFLPRKLQLMLTITLSFIPILFEEYHQIRIIQAGRGQNHNSFNPFISFFPIIIPLLHRTFIRADQIALSLPARGYDDE